MFFAIALLILIGTVVVTAATWIHFTGAIGWGWMAVPILIAVAFVGVILASYRWRHVVLNAAGIVTSVAVGYLNFAFVASLACWLVLGVDRVAGLGLDLVIVAHVLYAVAGLTTLYGLVNAARLRLTQVTVKLRGLPAVWEGKRVALVSDIHVGNVRGAKFVHRIVDRLAKLQPEAVFIAGDMFDGAKVDVGKSVQAWADLQAPGGKYFISGNHDEFGDRGPYLEALRRVGVRVLHNEKVEVNGLQILGVHDQETHRPALFQEILQRAEIDRRRASILIAHQPGHLEIPEQAGISLQLSGHTHGGQFWPWTLLVRRIYRQFAYGLSRFGQLQVYTSSGAGSWGPPMRVGTWPEIVVLRLEAQQ